MNIEKLIRERHSVRSYLSKEIEQDKLEVLNKLIDDINNEYDLNIQLITGDKNIFDNLILHYGRIKNCDNYIALVGKESKDLDIKLGYNGEKIVLKAQELGLNTCWVAGTYKKSNVTAKINDDEKLVCVIAIGYGETSGNPRKSKSIKDVSISSEYPKWYAKGIEYALLAPTAMNQQKFKFEYLDEDNVLLTTSKGINEKVDLGIVKYHFELGANKKVNIQIKD